MKEPKCEGLLKDTSREVEEVAHDGVWATSKVDSGTQTEGVLCEQAEPEGAERLPSWVDFRHNQAIGELLSFMVKKKTFTLNYVKRAMRDYL